MDRGKVNFYGASRRRALSLIVLLAAALDPAGTALSDDGAGGAAAPAKSSNCSDYRSKREGVPVFAKPDPASRVVSQLARGAVVCYVGEVGSFAIVEWDVPPEPDAEDTRPSPVGYIRLVDLWEPEDRRKTQPGDSQLEEYYRYRQTGTAPDDPLWLFRPFLRLFGSGDPCANPGTIGCAGTGKNSAGK